MQSKRRTTAVVLTGAVGLASAAYALGSEAGGGSAVAGPAKSRNCGPEVMFERVAPPDFKGLADTLGVDAGELREALLDFHEQEHADRRDELATALAEALDIPVDKVTAALDKVQMTREAHVEKRREAFREGGPPAEVRRLHVMPLRQLATALDVTRAELRKAFQEIRPERGERFEEHTQALAEFLAERFDLNVDEVSDALADLPRPTPPPHVGRPGPGGPGALGPRP
jgi:hypothetical protein